jgi:catechol 2,3-dioxygenase-like lactoylglutathione lyase family enzyme
MPLSAYMEVEVLTPDPAAAHAFYANALGFEAVGDAVLTDGAFNLRIAAGETEVTRLHYMGADADEVRAAGITVQQSGSSAVCESPDGYVVRVSADDSPVPMPPGTPATRVHVSKLGRFGEFALPVRAFKKSARFWVGLRYRELHTADIPYPYGLFSDGLFVIGLHQNPLAGGPQATPRITYVMADMPDRIAALRDAGVELTGLETDESGIETTAEFSGPGGLRFFLLQAQL